MKNSRKHKSFSLIEILITSSLVAVIGLAVYSTFSSGLKIWQRVNKTYIEEDINIFFAKIATDLRNTSPYKGRNFSIGFVGTEDNLSFPTLVTATGFLAGPAKTLGQVIYYFDPAQAKVFKHTKNISQVFKESPGFTQELLKGVQYLAFEYYFYDPLQGEYFWLEEWPEGSLPLAVRVRLTVSYGDQTYSFTKTVSIPASGEKI